MCCDDPLKPQGKADIRSTAVAQNLSLPIVGKLLGHKSSKSTERYAHFYTDVMANAANKVGG